MIMFSYSPLSLTKLCMNVIIKKYWKSDIESILYQLPPFLQEDYWKSEFKKRYEIIKLCS